MCPPLRQRRTPAWHPLSGCPVTRLPSILPAPRRRTRLLRGPGASVARAEHRRTFCTSPSAAFFGLHAGLVRAPLSGVEIAHVVASGEAIQCIHNTGMRRSNEEETSAPVISTALVMRWLLMRYGN
jgi:hypothetical protein